MDIHYKVEQDSLKPVHPEEAYMLHLGMGKVQDAWGVLLGEIAVEDKMEACPELH